MDLTQHLPDPSATSAKRLRRAAAATVTGNNNRPRGILKHSSSWHDTDKAENRSPSISCKRISPSSSSSQYFDHEVAQDIVNSYKRPAIIVTHEEQMETCRLMIYDLIQFSGLLLEEKHDASLGVEGYTLALNVVHLQTKLEDSRGNTCIRFPPEELLTELVTYKHHTAKLLQRMHEAREKYGIYDRALDEAYYHTTYISMHTHADTHHSDCTMEPLHIKSCTDYMADTAESITSVVLYNMSVAYSLQNLHSLALKTCQLALQCTRFVPNAHRGMLIKTLVLRRMHSLLVGPVCCEDDIGADAYSEQQRQPMGQIALASGLDPTQISEELFTYEVYNMLTIYPSGAMAA